MVQGHSLEGTMTSDHFDFWCKACGSLIGALEFEAEEIQGVILKAHCHQCNLDYVFKLKVIPPLTKKS